MKLSIFFVAAAFSEIIDIEENTSILEVESAFQEAEIPSVMDSTILRSGPDERNFKKWKVLLNFFNKDTPDFSHKNLAMYGCQCGALGNDGKYDFYARGTGAPVDELDSACKEYSNCLKCLVDAHGDCDPNNRYKLRLDTVLGTATCRAKKETCKQNLCLCDVQFAKTVADIYATSYNADNKKYDRTQCVNTGTGGGNSPQGCCGTVSTFPFNRVYRGNQCCNAATAEIHELGSIECL